MVGVQGDINEAERAKRNQNDTKGMQLCVVRGSVTDPPQREAKTQRRRDFVQQHYAQSVKNATSCS